MKPVTLGIIGLIVGAVATGVVMSHVSGKEVKRWEARLAEQAESTAAWQVRTLAYQAEMARLRGDSSRLYRTWMAARLVRERGDTVGQTVEDVRDAANAEAQACSAVVLNCETRARNAESAFWDAHAQTVGLAAVLDTTAGKWKRAEARSRRRWFLSAGAGYGFILSGGKVYLGPSAQAGVSFRLWP